MSREIKFRVWYRCLDSYAKWKALALAAGDDKCPTNYDEDRWHADMDAWSKRDLAHRHAASTWRMFYPTSFASDRGAFGWCVGGGHSDLFHRHESSLADEDTILEQWTGLKDSKGVEIYEGDIISFDIHGATHGREREEGFIEPVWYSDEDAQFVFGKHVVPETTNERGFKTGGYTWWHSMADYVDRKTIQVLGNIHEHSHLLKS